MNAISRTLLVGIAAGVMVSILGCGGGAPVVPTGTVTGKVTLADQPLAGVTVAFFDEKTAISASGDTEADGTYTLKYAGGPKIPVGNYKVRVTAKEEPAKAPAAGGADPAAAKPSPVPKKYEAFETSQQTAVVKAEANKVDLPLKKE